MLTLLWTGIDENDESKDGWDIFHSKEELEEKISELIKEGFSEEDMMIFTTSDYLVPHNGVVEL